MKKVIILLFAAVVIAIFLLLHGLGFGMGFGFGNRSGDKDGTSTKNTKQIVLEVQDNTEQESDEENTTVIKVSVVENEYFYENEKISFDNLIERISSTEGKMIVEIKDENASKNAYESLINYLDDNSIQYLEK